MKHVKLIIVTLIFAIIAGFGALTDNNILQIIAVIASAIVGVTVTSLYEFIDTKGQGFKTWYQSQIKYKDEDLRLSFSYLYKIEVDGKYLLVRGHRMKDRYQPIGGVYKFYEQGREFLNSINLIIYGVRHSKNLGNFLKRF